MGTTAREHCILLLNYPIGPCNIVRLLLRRSKASTSSEDFTAENASDIKRSYQFSDDTNRVLLKYFELERHIAY